MLIILSINALLAKMKEKKGCCRNEIYEMDNGTCTCARNCIPDSVHAEETEKVADFAERTYGFEEIDQKVL